MDHLYDAVDAHTDAIVNCTGYGRSILDEGPTPEFYPLSSPCHPVVTSCHPVVTLTLSP